MSDETTASAAARLFDIRVLIGGLFVIYGLMLTIAGFFTSDSARHKAAGININLWLGIGMLVVGLFFLAWWKWRPLKPADEVDRHDPRESPGDRQAFETRDESATRGPVSTGAPRPPGNSGPERHR
jgi:hypothetical protein